MISMEGTRGKESKMSILTAKGGGISGQGVASLHDPGHVGHDSVRVELPSQTVQIDTKWLFSLDPKRIGLWLSM